MTDLSPPATLSTMPAERHPVRLRKARKKACPSYSTTIVRVKPSLHPCSSLTPFYNHRRISRLENQFMVMQSQIIGIQSTLDKILKAVQPNLPALEPGPQ